MDPRLNPLYVQEKWDHDRHCDGEGVMIEFDRFTLETRETECMYCKRIEQYRKMKEAKKNG